MRPLSKEALIYIIQHKGVCNTSYCIDFNCHENCEIFKTVNTNKLDLTDFQYSYNRAVSLFRERYSQEDLFEAVL